MPECTSLSQISFVLVLGGGNENGNKVVQWDRQQGSEDDWCFVDKGAGFYAIFNRGSGKALTVNRNSMQPGGYVDQWDFLDYANQLWRIQPKDGPVQVATTQTCATLQTTGLFKLIVKHSNQVLNVAGLSMNNGADLIQYPIEQAVDGNWRFESVGNGYYQIIAERSAKAVNGTLKMFFLDLI